MDFLIVDTSLFVSVSVQQSSKMYMSTRSYTQRVNKQANLTQREKRAFCGLPPKGLRPVSKKKQVEIIKKASLKSPRLYKSVLYERNIVKVRLIDVPLKHTCFKPNQLIRHFTNDEIRRAANKFWRLKEYYNI